ncbi:hypothetical protein Hanom_Chr16g01506951 [Helianthus anomalus]
MEDETLAPERPAASANGTVRPSETPMMTSRTISPAVKWCSLCRLSRYFSDSLMPPIVC